MAKCKACGADIEWIKTKAGKNMPCDAQIVTIVTDGGEVVSGRIPHWSTCPQADSFRKGDKR